MGMFNVIVLTHPIECPKCGKEVEEEWQSKELSLRGYYLRNDSSKIPLLNDIDGEMHNICSCGEFIEFSINRGKLKLIETHT